MVEMVSRRVGSWGRGGTRCADTSLESSKRVYTTSPGSATVASAIDTNEDLERTIERHMPRASARLVRDHTLFRPLAFSVADEPARLVRAKIGDE